MKITKDFIDCVYGPYSQFSEIKRFKMKLLYKLPDKRICELANVCMVNTKYGLFAIKIRMRDTREDGSIDIEKIHKRIRDADFIEISRKDYYDQDITNYKDISKITDNLVKHGSFVIFNMDHEIDYKRCKVLVDTMEFQKRIMDCITSEELDKFFECTTFSGDNKCRQAMIHGMCIAAMMASDCNLVFLEDLENE